MRAAHIVVDQGDIADASVVVAADSNGSFAFEVEAGGYMLYAFGLHQKPLSMPLIATGEPIQLDIWLGSIQLVEPLDSLRVIGDFNGYSPEEGYIPMTRQEDGSFAAAVDVDADTLGYQVVGALERMESFLPKDYPWRVAGTAADRFVFDRNGPRRRYESNYISVIVPENGKAYIVFEPREVPQRRNTRSIVASNPGALARLAQEYQETESSFAVLSYAQSSMRDTSTDGTTFDGREAAAEWYFRPLLNRIRSEPDSIVRQWLMVRYFDQFSGSKATADVDLLAELLDEVAPTSPIWSTRARSRFAISNMIVRMATVADADTALFNRLKEYIAKGAADHPDDDVRAQLMYIATSPSLRGEDEELLWHYYSRLVSSYPHSRYAEDLRRRYSPDRRIQSGERVPGFNFIALGDSARRYTDTSLGGSTYLIDFWGTWCAPCIEEMPYLHRAYEEYRDRGFSILSVAFMDTRESIETFRKDRWPMPWNHTLVLDEESEAVNSSFELTGLPRPVLVDEHGIIIATNRELRGERLYETLREHYGE